MNPVRKAGDRLLARIKKKWGRTVETETVPLDFSEFFIASRLAIRQLSEDYQDLYQMSHDESCLFFKNREKELDLLARSFENWKNERFITCAVIGDIGIGITALVHHFLQRTDPDIRVLRYPLHDNIHTRDQYFLMFQSMLQTQGLLSNQHLIEHIHALPNRHIIFLDGIQHLFLKKMGGFDYLVKLFELMSSTYKKIWWIGTCCPISWDYLDKTFSISHFFTDKIRPEPLGEDTIREILLEKCRLNGYTPVFVPDEDSMNRTSFQEQAEEEKQAELEKQFFTSLNRLSSGNIGLAQFYWLRSTCYLDDRTIQIKPICKLDFSFIAKLSDDALFALQVLLLHAALSLEAFAAAMNKPESECRNILIPMVEKGLLIRRKNHFQINPMISKYLSAYLSSRNFLH